MGSPRKCFICGEPLDEKGVPYKGHLIHSKCFNIAIKAVQVEKTDKLEKAKEEKKKKSTTKPVKETVKDPVSEEEYADKKAYYDYLRKLLDRQLDSKIYAVSDRIMKQYSYSYKGMHNTIIYLNEILQRELEGDIVGLIPFYYEDSQKYFESVEKVELNIEGIDPSGFYKTRTITITHPHKRKKKELEL